MTANSHDTLVAGLLIGASLATFGIGIIWFVRSEWAERQAVKAERIITDPAPYDWSLNDDWAAELAEHTERACRRLSSVAPVIPIQRKGGDS